MVEWERFKDDRCQSDMALNHKTAYLKLSPSFIFRTQITIFYLRYHCCLRSVERACMLNINNADYVLGYSPKWRKTGTLGDKVLNKLCYFFAHKTYSHSFTKLKLSHWCHIDYFSKVLVTFLDLGKLQVHWFYGGSESSQILSKRPTFVFRRWTKVWSQEFYC